METLPGEGDLLVDDELVAVAHVVGVEQLARPLHLLGTRQLDQILKKYGNKIQCFSVNVR